MNRRAIFGAAIWLGCLAAAQTRAVEMGTVELLFLLAPLVIIPLGLEVGVAIAPRLGAAGMRWLEMLQPWAAVSAAVAFFFPGGRMAAGFAATWAVFCGSVALVAMVFVMKAKPRTLPEWCVAIGMAYLPVGGLGFFLSRAGIAPIGYEEPIVLLTGVHFHYTAFAASVMAGAIGLANRSGRRRTLYTSCAVGLLAGTPLLGVGFTLWMPGVKLTAVAMIVGGVLGLAALMLMSLGGVRIAARVLLGISGLAVLVGMALAAAYGVGEFTGRSYVGLAEMARYHGIANGFGFTLCGLLGWRMAFANKEARDVAGD